MDKDWDFATQKQREEVVAAKALAVADDLELSFKLQMQDAITASRAPHTSAPEFTDEDFHGEADETRYTDLLFDDLRRLDEFIRKDRLLAQQKMNDSKVDVDRFLHDKKFATTLLKQDPKSGSKLESPYNLGESSTTSLTFHLYSKILVREELIRDDERKLGGFGVSICDAEDNPRFETSKVLADEELEHPQAAQLAAIVHGLNWALNLDIGRVIFFSDDSNILEYVTGKSQSSDPTVAALVDEIALLQGRFLSCQAKPVRKDLTHVIKLAKDVIAPQTRWLENGIVLETCPVCYEYVQPHEKFEVQTCFHRICVVCMKKHVLATLQRVQTLKCPYKDCESELLAEHCGRIANPDQIALMIERKIAAMIPPSERVHCQNPMCGILMQRRSCLEFSKKFFLDPYQSGARKCHVCNFCFCINCEVEWHYDTSCEEFRKTNSYRTSEKANLESLAKTHGWKRCGRCETMTALGDGCKHIICSYCKHEFCYTCGTEWVNKM